MTEVYADVLVALNTLFTYIILVATRVVCKIQTNKWGVAIAALIGGISSLIIFADELSVFLSVVYKLVTALVITTIAFLPNRFKIFFKVYFSFFAISFLFAGIMYGVEITFNPENILFINGTVYFDMSIAYLVGSILVIYGAFLGCNYFLQKNIISNNIYDVKISFRNSFVCLRGVIDTGNNLKDGVMGRMVIVAELNSLVPLFTNEEINYLKSDAFVNIPRSLERKIHLLPCKTVTGKSLLPAIIPDMVEFSLKGKRAQTDFIAVAIADEKLSDGEYKALLCSDILDLNWKESNHNEFIN